jgi:hypothetical protein
MNSIGCLDTSTTFVEPLLSVNPPTFKTGRASATSEGELLSDLLSIGGATGAFSS